MRSSPCTVAVLTLLLTISTPLPVAGIHLLDTSERHWRLTLNMPIKPTSPAPRLLRPDYPPRQPLQLPNSQDL